MSKTKRLLSVTLASVMLFASAFSALAEDTATVEPLVGKIAAGEVTVELADTEVTEVTVPVTITFENNQTSPHGMFDISADGATLKSATLVSFDNANYEKDPNLPDEENIDKSVYLDADGVNTANGRVVVESDVSEGKQPSVSYVTVDVVLEFATALEAGQVIDVVISNIAATNLSEASWDGMKAVNGKITVEADEPECDHADVTFVSATPATETDPGEISFTCDDCGNTVVEEVAYNAYNTVASFSAACESEIILQYDVWTSLFKADSDISTAMLVIDRVDYSGEEPITLTEILYPEDAVEFTAQDAPAYRWSYGIAAKMLNDTCTATVYCKADGVWYNGIVNVKTFAGYAKDNIKGTDSKMDTLFVDLLNYGAEAQKQFKYNDDPSNLANVALSEEQKALATATDPDATDIKATEYTLAAGHYIPAAYSLMCESRIQIRYSFMAYQFTAAPEDVKLVFTFTDYKNNPCTYTYEYYDSLVAEGNTDKIKAGEYFTLGSDGRIYVDFAKLNAADGDAAVVVKLYVGDNTEYDVSVTYSVASYVSVAREQNYTDVALTNALYKYCKAANAKFS